MQRAAFALLFVLACSGSDAPQPDARPNVLWVVWDTVRADRLSLYGHSRLTTPYLHEWARGARVFEDCLSTASSTVPSHAAMFTGLMPSEHGADNSHPFLDDSHTTIAELFQQAGYQTYLFAANPHISREKNFHQGFGVEEHPWDEKYRDEALRIVREKIPPEDRSSELQESLQEDDPGPWKIKAAGELAQKGLEEWLAARDPDRPFFAFLNYMEAHRPFVPARKFRARMMTAEQLRDSYQVDRSWTRMWSYSFGLHEYDARELETMAATYDATLAELDALFRDLFRMLEERIDLDRTIVVLTSDHGEHLGEHHLLDHQYSLYNPLIRVPLAVRYPPAFEPGSESRPVMNFDLFPTLLELAGIEAPLAESQAQSLLAPLSRRTRVSEYPSPFSVPFESVRQVHPGWEPTPWLRVLRALQADGHKYIWASDGRHELYRYPEDPEELEDLIAEADGVAASMQQELDRFVARLSPALPRAEPPEMSDEARERLEALGYLVDDRADAPVETPALPVGGEPN